MSTINKPIESISIFDMLKIGVGPSSSHTLGPWRAARRFIKKLKKNEQFDKVTNVQVDLYGSLSLTGKGHATDVAVVLGLTGADPQTCSIEGIPEVVAKVKETNQLTLDGEKNIKLTPAEDIVFNRNFLPFHPNGITFTA